jgi:hypothetical protein
MIGTYTDILTDLARFITEVNNVNIVQMCGLAKGTSTHTLKTTQQVVYSLFNKQITFALTDNIAMTPCNVQAVNTFCYYLVSANLAFIPVITVTKGTDNIYALPTIPWGNIPIAVFKVTTDLVTTFTSGTTDLAAVGLTVQYFDLDVGIATKLLNQAMRGLERKTNFRGMKIRVAYALASAFATAFDNPIPLYKQLLQEGGAYGVDALNKRYPINKQDIDEVEGAFLDTQTGPPQLITEIPATETILTPDTIPNLQFLIRPIPDAAYTVVLTGYQYSPYLDGVIYDQNWWTMYHSDVLLFGALVQAEMYLKNDSRIQVWKEMYNEKLGDLIVAESDEQYSGSSKYGQGR